MKKAPPVSLPRAAPAAEPYHAAGPQPPGNRTAAVAGPCRGGDAPSAMAAWGREAPRFEMVARAPASCLRSV